MRILIAIDGLHRDLGGPPKMVAALVDAYAQAGHHVDLCTLFVGDDLGPEATIDRSKVHVHTSQCKRMLKGRIRRPVGFFPMIDKLAPHADVIHSMGIWPLTTHLAAKAARRHNKPHLVSPLGMLKPNALTISPWRKRIARWAYLGRDLREADHFHAQTVVERDNVHAYPPSRNKPVAVIAQGANLPTPVSGDERERVRKKFQLDAASRNALFLARVHPIKNIDNLIRAWGQLRHQPHDAQLLIAGADEMKLVPELKTLAEGCGAGDAVRFLGAVDEKDKVALLAEVDLFTLPSRSEGFSLAILEALATPLPVLISTGCCFPEVASANAGVVTGIEPESIAEGLSSLLAKSDDELAKMRQNARRLIEQHYTWPRIAEQFLALYAQLAQQGPKPSCATD